ncbi:hypothetical protein Tco_0854472 [Tanacetum coccineum]
MVVSSTSLTGATRKAAVSEKLATKKLFSTPISKSADDIMTFRKELDALALKHLGPVPATAPTSTNPVNTGSDNLNIVFEEVTPGNIEAISPSADHEEEPGNGSQTNQANHGKCNSEASQEPEAQGRKSQDDPQDSSIKGLVTPPTTKGICFKGGTSPLTREGDTREEKRLKEVNTTSKVNTGSIKLNTVIEQDSTAGEDKGQREGKAPMLSEETPKKSKEQILQEEASLAEAIRLDSLQKEEEAKQIYWLLSLQKNCRRRRADWRQKKRKSSSYCLRVDESTKKSGRREQKMARTRVCTQVLIEYDSEESMRWWQEESNTEPLSTDSIWSELGQQKIISWRYYDTCRVHCLNLESMEVYMLSERKYPLSAEFTMSNNIRTARLRQNGAGKTSQNPVLMVGHLANICAKGLTSPEQTATGKGISNPLMAVMVCQKPYGIQLTNVSSTECLKWFSVDHGHTPFGGQRLLLQS